MWQVRGQLHIARSHLSHRTSSRFISSACWKVELAAWTQRARFLSGQLPSIPPDPI
jgi:hypothetical protein